MTKGVFLGLTTVDILNYVSHYPLSNEKLRADQQLIFAGGPAANGAVAYAAFSNETQLITGLGEQPLADLARADLVNHRVSVVDLADDMSALPVLSSITVDTGNGDRSVVYTNTTGRSLAWNGEQDQVLEGATVLMLDGYYLSHACEVAAMAGEKRIPVVLDGGSWKEGLEQLLPYVDYAICSENFIPPECSDGISVFKYLEAIGVGNASISRGAQPMLAWSDGCFEEIAVGTIDVVDTLGAGDILHGTFCHFIGKNDFFTSLALASAVSTKSCQFRGTRKWIEHCR